MYQLYINIWLFVNLFKEKYMKVNNYQGVGRIHESKIYNNN